MISGQSYRLLRYDTVNLIYHIIAFGFEAMEVISGQSYRLLRYDTVNLLYLSCQVSMISYYSFWF